RRRLRLRRLAKRAKNQNIETREIRLHPAGLVGQDGILRAGWQPAPGGHWQTSRGGLPTRRRLATCPTFVTVFCEPPQKAAAARIGRPTGHKRRWPVPLLLLFLLHRQVGVSRSEERRVGKE